MIIGRHLAREGPPWEYGVVIKGAAVEISACLPKSAYYPGCVKTIFRRFKRNIHPFIEFLQSIKSMA